MLPLLFNNVFKSLLSYGYKNLGCFVKAYSYHLIEIGKKQKMKGKTAKQDTMERNMEEPTSIPNQHIFEKEYEPRVFEDTHISDVIKENEEMKTKVKLHIFIVNSNFTT